MPETATTFPAFADELVRLDDRSLVALIYDVVDKIHDQVEEHGGGHDVVSRLDLALREAFERFAPEVESVMQTQSIWANEIPSMIERALEEAAGYRAERQAQRVAAREATVA
jgi:hypothetical protein